MREREILKIKEKYAVRAPKYFYGLLLLLVFVLYGNTLRNDYNLDDNLVTQNHRLTSKGVSALPEIFSSFYYEDESGYAYEYRPLVLTSFALEHSLFGEKAAVGHFINLMLYALSLLFLLQLLLSLFHAYSPLLSCLAVLIFAAHPMHVEVVASLKNRDEILAFLFVVLAWRYAYRYALFCRFKDVLFFAFFFSAALLSKLSVVGFSILIPLSLILFSKLKIRNNLVLSGISSLLILAINPLYNVWHQFYLLSTIFLMPAFIQVIISPTLRRELLKYMKNIFWPKYSAPQKTEELAIPQFEIHPILFLGWMMCFVFLGMAGIFKNNLPWSLLAVFSFLSLFFFAQNKYKSIAAFCFVAMGIATAYYFNMVLLAHFILWSCIFFIIHFSQHKWYYLLLYGICFFPAYLLIKNNIFISAIVIAGFLLFKSNRVVAFYFVGFLVAFFYTIFVKNNVIALNDYLIYFSNFLFPLAIIIPLFKKIKAYILLFFMGGVILFSIGSAPSYSSAASSVSFSPFKAQILENKPVLNTNRPLNFIEFPLGFEPSISEKVGTSSTIVLEYLKMTFLPYPFRFYFGFAEVEVKLWHHQEALISLFFITLLIVLAILWWKKHPPASFGILFYLVSIFVFSNWWYPVVGMMAERYLFHALLGFSITTSYFILKALRLNLKESGNFNFTPKLKLVLPILLFPYSYLTIVRNSDWKDPITLMEGDIEYLSNSAHANYLLGYHLMQNSLQTSNTLQAVNQRKKAIIYYRQSLKIYPENVNACVDLGDVYLSLNDLDNAYLCLKKACEMDTSLHETALKLAQIAEEKNKYVEAIEIYRKIIQVAPYKMEVYGSLSFLYFKLNEYEKSIDVNLEAIKYEPNWKAPYENIARVYYSVGDTAKANYYLAQMPK